MTTLHEARIERAARLVAEAETARADAWDKANADQAVWFAARGTAVVSLNAAWAADSALFASRAAQAKANAEVE